MELATLVLVAALVSYVAARTCDDMFYRFEPTYDDGEWVRFREMVSGVFAGLWFLFSALWVALALYGAVLFIRGI